jgi:hypothetical protein
MDFWGKPQVRDDAQDNEKMSSIVVDGEEIEI